jgi:hypothetical protein
VRERPRELVDHLSGHDAHALGPGEARIAGDVMACRTAEGGTLGLAKGEASKWRDRVVAGV